jgi:hypothetical protein
MSGKLRTAIAESGPKSPVRPMARTRMAVAPWCFSEEKGEDYCAASLANP